MARSVDDIQQLIIDQKNAEPELVDLDSPSQVAIWRLWSRITAIAINIFEQIVDASVLVMEQLARDATAGTTDWVQRRVLEFQYSDSNPQVITVIDGVASYPTVNPSLRIVTRASVKTTSNGSISVKVAKGVGVLEPLNTNELNALKGYLAKIGIAGITITTISLNADRFRFQGEVFFSGEFVGSDVKANIIIALNEYLSSISIEDFAGKVVREKAVDSIQAVNGVIGIDTINVQLNGRPEQDSLGGANNINIQREYETSAGYIIEEDTPNNTFNDTINNDLIKCLR